MACASSARSSTSSKAADTFESEERRVGILGGTFNPPHLGHLALARTARDELQLERVLLIPVNTPPHKPPGPLASPEDRLRMCELLVAREEGLSVCGFEVDRPGPSYTVDTLDHIHASKPHAELTFIVGADSARTLSSWREPAKLLQRAQLAVAARPSSPRREVLEIVRRVAGGRESGELAAARVRFLHMPPLDVSSSAARERAARGEPIEELVGPSVASYIAERKLYRARRAGALTG